jgi:hypothetical protein
MGVRVVDNFRLSIQFVTLILAFVGVIEMFAIIHWRGPGWPLMIVPAVIALEIIAFYGWLVIIGPLTGYSIGPIANNISAIIRLQVVTVVVIYLTYIIYQRYLKLRNND